jgi:enamine deaminase RidA (YjgF/YER057c/UK114 family)
MAELLGAAFERRFGGARPAASLVMGSLARPNALVAMDAVATAPRVAERTPKVAVLPAGPRVYISGQAAPGDVRTATADTLESLKRTLTFLGLELTDVIQAKAFLQPISAAAEVEKEMQAFFGPNPPPVVLVEWRSKIPIEIELIARSPASAGAPVEYLTPPGEKRARVYTRVARVHHPDTIYISGLFGGAGGEARAQILDIFESLRAIARQTGSDLRHLVKATYYVTDDASSQLLNDLRPDYYEDGRAPAASKAMVPGTGFDGRTITMDMIAVPAK